MIFVDSNVLIDVLSPDQTWKDWSDRKLASLSDTRELVINHIILAEIAANFINMDTLAAGLESLDIEVVPLSDDVAFSAGTAFRAYRREHRERTAILSDFLIGGHAMSLSAKLLTRDQSIYRTYFPDLTLITPETHP